MPVKKSSNKGGVLSWILAVVVVSVAAIGVGWLIGQQVLNFMNPADDSTQTAQNDDSGYTYYPWSSDTDTPATSNVTTTATNAQQSQDTTNVTDQNNQGTTQNQTDTTSTTTSSQMLYKVRVGSFASREEALDTSVELEAMGLPIYVMGSYPYSIQVGAFSNMSNALNLSEELNSQGYSAFVVE